MPVKTAFLSAIAVVSLLGAVPATTLADDWPLKGLPDEAQLAWQALRRTDVFAFGPIGVAGETSEGELAMRILMRHPNAIAIFQRLTRSSTIDGCLYALSALRSLDRAAYAEVQSRLPRDQEVSLKEGCIGWKESAAEVLSKLESGKYDSVIPKHTK